MPVEFMSTRPLQLLGCLCGGRLLSRQTLHGSSNDSKAFGDLPYPVSLAMFAVDCFVIQLEWLASNLLAFGHQRIRTENRQFPGAITEGIDVFE